MISRPDRAITFKKVQNVFAFFLLPAPEILSGYIGAKIGQAALAATPACLHIKSRFFL
jgi:hypothetical protein